MNSGGTNLLEAGWRALQAGQPAEAERLCRLALKSNDRNSDGAFLLGLACHSQGRLAEAEGFYRTTLTLRPDFPEALVNLSSLLERDGRLTDAESLLRKALLLTNSSAEAYFNLGNVLRRQKRLQEAAECYLSAQQLRPDFAPVYHNLGSTLRGLGKLTEAENCFRQALQLQPDMPEALLNLASVLGDTHRHIDAEALLRQALRLRPDFAEAHFNLGNTLRELGNPKDAVDCYSQALQFRPNFASAFINLGNALRDLGCPKEAEKHFREALRLDSASAEGHVNLGCALRDLGRFEEAISCFRRGLQLRSDLPEAYHHLGGALRDMSRHDEAVVCFRQALQLRPDYVVAHDGLLLTLLYRSETTPEDLATAHAEFERWHAAPLRTAWRPHTNNRDPERPLRVGFVSADFGRHPVGYLLVRAAEALSPRPVTVIYYSNRQIRGDELTTRFQRAATHWREIAGLNDVGLADLVRADQIDVLIDLAGHTGGNRLQTFARRPAPVQATWLGYEGTTGLNAIDYLIADDRMVPEGAESYYCERILRLPGGYACYDPPSNAPDAGPVPMLASNRTTFGCFNNPAKLSRPALLAFAEVLRRVPESRLILKYRGFDDPAMASRWAGAFASAGLDRNRVELRGVSDHYEYLAAFREIDLALDTFPFGGGVTTCDALWMGVPAITLPLQTFASRHGLSYLNSVGLAELAARDVEQFAGHAAQLADDPRRLSELRAGLRERMAQSQLCDGDRLADELLNALRIAWRNWVTGDETDSFLTKAERDYRWRTARTT